MRYFAPLRLCYFISRQVCIFTFASLIDFLNCSALRSVSITEISPLLWLRLTSHSLLLLQISPSMRPHGISSSIFPRLPAQFTYRSYDCLLDFTASSQLIHSVSLNIRFLFVRLRLRYCFFSPTSRDVRLANHFGVRRQLRPNMDFHHRLTACPSY